MYGNISAEPINLKSDFILRAKRQFKNWDKKFLKNNKNDKVCMNNDPVACHPKDQKVVLLIANVNG